MGESSFFTSRTLFLHYPASYPRNYPGPSPSTPSQHDLSIENVYFFSQSLPVFVLGSRTRHRVDAEPHQADSLQAPPERPPEHGIPAHSWAKSVTPSWPIPRILSAIALVEPMNIGQTHSSGSRYGFVHQLHPTCPGGRERSLGLRLGTLHSPYLQFLVSRWYPYPCQRAALWSLPEMNSTRLFSEYYCFFSGLSKVDSCLAVVLAPAFSPPTGCKRLVDQHLCKGKKEEKKKKITENPVINL